MRRRDMELYMGIILLIIVLLNIFGVLNFIGITQRFVDIVYIAVGVYFIVMGLKK